MKKYLAVVFVLLGTAAVSGQQTGFAGRPGTASRESSVSAARELYATARYDEALALLNGIRTSDATDPAERKTIEQYRSLCLLALGRAQEAEVAIAAAVTADPFFVPSEAEASPRVRTAFSEVRSKLLPGIVSARYTAAKQTFDRKEHAAAERQFRDLVMLIDDPQMNGRLADLRMLVTGFLDLATAAAAPPAASAKVEAPAAAAAPVASAPSKPVTPMIYGGEEPGIVAPVAIRQQFPAVPASIASMTKDRGILEVIIDEQGRVISLTLRVAIHPVYDTMLVGAARDWKYKPATMNGVPVRYRKMIQVQLPRRQP